MVSKSVSRTQQQQGLARGAQPEGMPARPGQERTGRSWGKQTPTMALIVGPGFAINPVGLVQIHVSGRRRNFKVAENGLCPHLENGGKMAQKWKNRIFWAIFRPFSPLFQVRPKSICRPFSSQFRTGGPKWICARSTELQSQDLSGTLSGPVLHMPRDYSQRCPRRPMLRRTGTRACRGVLEVDFNSAPAEGQQQQLKTTSDATSKFPWSVTVSDILFPYRSPSPRPHPRPHPDPTQHPETDPKQTRNGAKRTRNGAQQSRNGPKSSPFGWDSRGFVGMGGGGICVK